MAVPQGDLELLNDPIAQELLRSALPARLAYTWPDGTPRVVPIWFHWTGEEIVMAGPPDAPKMDALRANPRVALTIDGDTWPYKVLLLRGEGPGRHRGWCPGRVHGSGAALFRGGAGERLGGAGRSAPFAGGAHRRPSRVGQHH